MLNNLPAFRYQHSLSLLLTAIVTCTFAGCPGPNSSEPQIPTVEVPEDTWISQQTQLQEKGSAVESLQQKNKTLQQEKKTLQQENETLRKENKGLQQETAILLQFKTAVEGTSVMAGKVWQCSYVERICYWIGLLIIAKCTYTFWKRGKRFDPAAFLEDIKAMAIGESTEDEQ